MEKALGTRLTCPFEQPHKLKWKNFTAGSLVPKCAKKPY